MFVAMNMIIIPQAPEARHVPDDFAPTRLADLTDARAINIPPLTRLRTIVGHFARFVGLVALLAVIWCCCGCETVGEQATRSAVEWVGEGVGNLVSDGADSLTRERKCRVWMVANVLPMLPASSQVPWMLPEVQRTALFRQLDTRDCRDCVGFTNFVRAGLGTEVFAGRWFGHSNVVTLARFNTNGLGFVWVALDQRGYWFEHGAGTNVSSIPW